MKIYNSITIDIATGRTIAEDSFDYDGPIAQCFSTSSGGGSSVNKESSQLAQQFATETEPVRKTFTNQLQEALTTGGVGARIPIIEKAVESTRSAASKSLTQTTEDLATKKLVGTPFGEAILAATKLQGDLSAENVRNAFIQQLLEIIPNYLLGTGQSAIAGKSATTGDTSGSFGFFQNACCFIFIASHGYLHPIVRRYRDEHMTVCNRRGYYWLADRLVPQMAKHRFIEKLVAWLMVNPMTCYGKYYYGLNKWGWIFAGLTSAWLRIYTLLGLRPPYTRRGTKEVV